jgi:hypothetical protein
MRKIDILVVCGVILGALLLLAACGQYDLTEKRYTRITGRVLDSAGVEVKDAGVLVRTQAAGSVPRVWQTVTDSEGSYSVEVEWYKFADYFLLVVHPKRGDPPHEGADYDHRIPAWEYKDKLPQDDLKISIIPTGGNTFSGLVLLDNNGDGAGDAPLAGVEIKFGAGVSATTDAHGAFTKSGLQNGAYTLTPTLTGYTFAPATRQISLPADTWAMFTATQNKGGAG